MVALWGVPAVAVILAGAPARLVSAKFAGVETPVTEAVTLYGPPAVPLAVKIAAIATPCALVVAVRSEEHTSELQSHSDLVCRLLLEKKKKRQHVSPAVPSKTLLQDGHFQHTLMSGKLS